MEGRLRGINAFDNVGVDGEYWKSHGVNSHRTDNSDYSACDI